MDYHQPGGTTLKVRRDSGQRQLHISLRGYPITWRGRMDTEVSLSWTVRGAEAEALLREMVMIAERWGVTADVEAAR
jgi:hypothetical protein